MRGFAVKHIIVLAAIVLIVFGIVNTSTLRRKEGFEPNDTMQEDDTLKRGEGITSANGLYKLAFGVDGSLKIVKLNIKRGADASLKIIRKFDVDTKKTDTILRFQLGNLAIVDTSNDDKVIWETKTSGKGGKLWMRDNGDLVIKNDKDVTVWTSDRKKMMAMKMEGFTTVNINTDTIDTSFNSIRNDADELKSGLAELDRLGNPNTNVSKLQMDTTVYISILWTTMASAMIYLLAKNI
jgi:hypothetical protein